MYSVIKLTQWSSRRLHTIHCFVLGAEVKKKNEVYVPPYNKKKYRREGVPCNLPYYDRVAGWFFFSFFLRKVTHSRCVKRELSKNVSWHGIVSNYRFYPFTHGYHLKKKVGKKHRISVWTYTCETYSKITQFVYAWHVLHLAIKYDSGDFDHDWMNFIVLV